MLKLNRAKAKWRVKFQQAFEGQGTNLFFARYPPECQSVCKAPVAARENGHSSCCLLSPSCARAWKLSFLSEAFPWASQQSPSQLPLLLALYAALSAALLSIPSPAVPVSIVPRFQCFLAECPIPPSAYGLPRCDDELPFAHRRWPFQQGCLGLPRICVQPSVRPFVCRFCHAGG
jgi:hypothetical protein